MPEEELLVVGPVSESGVPGCITPSAEELTLPSETTVSDQDASQQLIARYQACALRILELFAGDPLGDHPAHTCGVERLEAILDLGLLTPGEGEPVVGSSDEVLMPEGGLLAVTEEVRRELVALGRNSTQFWVRVENVGISGQLRVTLDIGRGIPPEVQMASGGSVEEAARELDALARLEEETSEGYSVLGNHDLDRSLTISVDSEEAIEQSTAESKSALEQVLGEDSF